MSPRLPFRWIARALALLLLAAAALKANGLGVDPVGKIGTFTAPAFQIGVIEFEIFLALWLLSGKQPLGAWLSAVGCFVAFAAVNCYQGWVGVTTCGCFGRLSMNPWYVVGIDVVVLCALALGRPSLETTGDRSRAVLAAIRPAGIAAVAVSLSLAAVAGAASWAYGSFDNAVAQLRGELITTQPRLVDVGTGAAGEAREVEIRVVNHSKQAIRIIGGTHD